MSDIEQKMDALGNPVKLGYAYGYTQQKGGWTYVVIGKALHFTNNRVTIEIWERRRFLYGKPSGGHTEKPVASVTSNILFPVVYGS